LARKRMMTRKKLITQVFTWNSPGKAEFGLIRPLQRIRMGTLGMMEKRRIRI
jgi:hypothetical protein